MLRLATVNALIDKAIDYAKSLFENISGDHTPRNSIVLRLQSQSVIKKSPSLAFSTIQLLCNHLLVLIFSASTTLMLFGQIVLRNVLPRYYVWESRHLSGSFKAGKSEFTALKLRVSLALKLSLVRCWKSDRYIKTGKIGKVLKYVYRFGCWRSLVVTEIWVLFVCYK